MRVKYGRQWRRINKLDRATPPTGNAPHIAIQIGGLPNWLVDLKSLPAQPPVGLLGRGPVRILILLAMARSVSYSGSFSAASTLGCCGLWSAQPARCTNRLVPCEQFDGQLVRMMPDHRIERWPVVAIDREPAMRPVGVYTKHVIVPRHGNGCVTDALLTCNQDTYRRGIE